MGTAGAKRKKEFVRLSDATKLNPNSLVETFLEIEDVLFGGNRHIASIELSKLLARLPPSRHRPKQITYATLKNLMSNKKAQLKYWHIEMFAHAVNLPSGLLLIYSRLKSNSHSADGAKEAQQLLHALKEISSKQNSSDVPNIDMLKKWSAWYKPGLTGPLI